MSDTDARRGHIHHDSHQNGINSNHVKSIAPSPSRPTRRRNRASKTCRQCSERHIKCSQILPCYSCIQRGIASECAVEVPSARRAALSSVKRRKSSAPVTSAMACGAQTASQQSLPAVTISNTAKAAVGQESASRAPFMLFLDQVRRAMQSGCEASFPWLIISLSLKCENQLQTASEDVHLMGHPSTVMGERDEYPREAQDLLATARGCLPRRSSDVKYMLYRCISLAPWIGCPDHSDRECGLVDPPALQSAMALFGSNLDEGPFPPSLSMIGDAARLCLVLSMVLGALSFSSSRLASLCFQDHPNLQNAAQISRFSSEPKV